MFVNSSLPFPAMENLLVYPQLVACVITPYGHQKGTAKEKRAEPASPRQTRLGQTTLRGVLVCQPALLQIQRCWPGKMARNTRKLVFGFGASHPSWIDLTERQRSKEQGTDRYSERVRCLSLEPLPCFCVPRIRYVSVGLLSLVTLKVMKYHATGEKHCEDFCLRRCTPCNYYSRITFVS